MFIVSAGGEAGYDMSQRYVQPIHAVELGGEVQADHSSRAIEVVDQWTPRMATASLRPNHCPCSW